MAMLQEEVDNLRATHTKTRQKCKRSTWQIAREYDLTGAKAAEVLQPTTQAIEHI
jgi:hypothetical protein